MAREAYALRRIPLVPILVYNHTKTAPPTNLLSLFDFLNSRNINNNRNIIIFFFWIFSKFTGIKIVLKNKYYKREEQICFY